MKFLIGTKHNMTQLFHENGAVVPVTRVVAGPCVVTQVENLDSGHRVQVGFGEAKHVLKPQAGHLKGLPQVAHMRSYVTEQELNRGDVLSVTSFVPGDRVAVTGTSKGKGFQGVVKRHGFNGHKDQLRMPGSIGATDAARVFKGTRMGGQMGNERVTISNLEVVAVDPETHEIMIKGAIPGAKGGLVMIAAEGEMVVGNGKVAEEKSAEEAPKEEVSAAEQTTS